MYDFAELRAPFAAEDIEWRVQTQGERNGQPFAIVLPYITNRAIQDRLDAVVGPHNWVNKFEPGPGGGVLCGIGILFGDQWHFKWDGADNTDIEAVKGGLSDSMKRAAVQWGIGRYLYKMPKNLKAKFHAKGRYFTKINGNPYRWDPPEEYLPT